MTNYNFPITFGGLAAGNQPLSDFDTNFDSAARMGTLMCLASGTNAVTLTSLSNYPTLTNYGNLQKVGFLAATTSTTLVTVGYSALSVLNAYLDDGVTQVGSTVSNGLTGGSYYEFAYNSALNLGTGGWQQISSNVTPAGAGISVINIQRFTSSGTYTATGGLVYAIVEMVGGGGGGGGIGVPDGGGSGGGSGGYLKAFLTAAQIGASQVITVGPGGSGGTTAPSSGGNGSVTSVGSLLSCNGGVGGTPSAGAGQAAGGAGGTATITTGTPILTMTGQAGGYISYNAAVVSGAGGSNPLGFGGPTVTVYTGPAVGVAGTGYGAGGSGAAQQASVAAAGGAGTGGIVIITEFCS